MAGSPAFPPTKTASYASYNLSKIVLTGHFWLTKEQDVGSRMDEVQYNYVLVGRI